MAGRKGKRLLRGAGWAFLFFAVILGTNEAFGNQDWQSGSSAGNSLDILNIHIDFLGLSCGQEGIDATINFSTVHKNSHK
jgi:hypothetical protein